MTFSLLHCRKALLYARVAGLVAGLLAVVIPAFASAADWRLVKATGDVRVHGAGGEWVKAKPKQALRPGESIWTGRGSRALIETDDGTVLLNSRSLVKVPAQALPDRMTVLFQGQGKVTARVRKKKEKHFSVQTPFLAAVVKGTEFTLDMGSRKTRLSVSRGVVGAVDPLSGDAVDVRAGESLTTSHTPGASVASAQQQRSISGETVEAGGSGPGDGNDRGRNDGRDFGRISEGPGGGGSGNSGGGNSGGGNSGGDGHRGHGLGHGHGHPEQDGIGRGHHRD